MWRMVAVEEGPVVGIHGAEDDVPTEGRLFSGRVGRDDVEDGTVKAGVPSGAVVVEGV